MYLSLWHFSILCARFALQNEQRVEQKMLECRIELAQCYLV